jgi:hypothetical protein
MTDTTPIGGHRIAVTTENHVFTNHDPAVFLTVDAAGLTWPTYPRLTDDSLEEIRTTLTGPFLGRSINRTADQAIVSARRLFDELTLTRTALAAVRKLHTPREEEILPYACMEGDCDHPEAMRDSDGCPPVKVQVCTECTNLAWAKDPEWLPGEARFPCATIKAIEAVLA